MQNKPRKRKPRPPEQLERKRARERMLYAANPRKRTPEQKAQRRVRERRYYHEVSEVRKALRVVLSRRHGRIRYLLSTPDERRASFFRSSKQRRQENRERYREAGRKQGLRWREANRSKARAIVRKRQASKLQRTPQWVDHKAIEAIYAECERISKETGMEHHVDHFYPLQGKLVSGLHVETNLRIIPASDNCRKHNSMPETT